MDKSIQINTIKVLGVKIDLKNKRDIIYLLNNAIENNKKIVITTTNIESIYQVNTNINLKGLFDYSNINTCDSEVLRKILLLNGVLIDKITGSDLIDLCNKISTTNIKCYLLGSTDNTLINAKLYFSKMNPNLCVVGVHNGFFEATEIIQIINDINKHHTQVLIVGMGCPMQELWVRDNLKYLNVNIIICVGGVLEIIAQTKKRAPIFLQKWCLEWLWRLSLEPSRLWKRYLVYNMKIFIKLLFSPQKNIVE